jgi:hypothetical protein
MTENEFPKRMFIYQSTHGWMLAGEDIDDIPNGAIVGIYQLHDVQRKRVDHSMEPRDVRRKD